MSIALIPTLEAIKNKNIDDGNWFVLGAQGALELRPKPHPPQGLFARIRSCIARALISIRLWIRWEIPPLERKFIWISNQVEAHLEQLVQERDEAGLGTFLNTYTTAINELYRCAAKMYAAGRLYRSTLNHLQGKERIRDYILTEIDRQHIARAGEREYHPYARLVQFWVENELPGSKIKFRLGNLPQEDLEAGKSRSHNFMSVGNSPRFVADVTMTRPILVQKGVNNICFGNPAESKEQKQEKEGVHFVVHNETNRTLNIAVKGFQPEKQKQPVVGPKQSISFSMKADVIGKTIAIVGTYTLEHPFTFGCKLARYRAIVDRDGQLKTRIEPFYPRENLPEVEQQVNAEHPLEVHNDTENPRTMQCRVQRVDGTTFEHHWFIPKRREVRHTYQTLCAQAGIEPADRPQLRVQVLQQNTARIIPSQARA